MDKFKENFTKFKQSKIGFSLYALLISMIAGSIVLIISGNNPLIAYGAVVKATFSKPIYFVYTLALATPLIFTGLAFVIAKKAGLISLGAEGQLYLGAIIAGAIGIYMDLPTLILIPFALICGMLVGGIWGLIPGILKVKFSSNEVITTLMLNYIAIYLVSFIINQFMLDPSSGVIQTSKILENAELLVIYDRSIFTISFFIAVIVALLLEYFFKKTVLGYEITAVGLNKKAAETAGINVNRIIIITMFISGSVAALAGATHVLGVDHRVIANFSPGYGFDGVSVASLSAGSPIGVIFSAFIFGAFKNGSMYISRTTDIPMDFVYLIQAFVVIFVASPRMLKDISTKSHDLVGKFKKEDN